MSSRTLTSSNYHKKDWSISLLKMDKTSLTCSTLCLLVIVLLTRRRWGRSSSSWRPPSSPPPAAACPGSRCPFCTICIHIRSNVWKRSINYWQWYFFIRLRKKYTKLEKFDCWSKLVLLLSRLHSWVYRWRVDRPPGGCHPSVSPGASAGTPSQY